MIKEDLKIGFIGAGNMASALISGLIQSNHSASCIMACLLYTSPSPRDVEESRMPSSA